MSLGNDRKLRNYKTRCLCIAIVFYVESFWAWDAAREMEMLVWLFYLYVHTYRLWLGSDEAFDLQRLSFTELNRTEF